MSFKARAAIMAVGSLLALVGGATRVAAGSPSADISVGAALWHEEGRNGVGWNGSIALHPWGGLGLVGDAGHYGELGHSWMAGLRYRFPGQGTVGFVEVLLGHAPLDDFALQPGLGIEWTVARQVAIRLAGHLKIAGDGGTVYTGTRVSLGVVFRLGNR